MVEHHDGRALVTPFRLRIQRVYEGMLEEMAEWTVAQIVTKTCDLDAKYVLVCYLQLRLTNLQVFDQFPGQVTDSNAVLESIVRSAWKYQIGCAKLFDVPQSLKLGSVHDLNAQIWNLDMTVDRIVDDLRIRQNRRPLPCERLRTGSLGRGTNAILLLQRGFVRCHRRRRNCPRDTSRALEITINNVFTSF